MDLSGVVDRYCGHDEAIMNENANKNSKVFATQRDLLAGSISKEYALEKLLPKNVAEGHRNGWIHFHDLDYTLNASGGLYNCMLIDFPGMLKHGFTLGEAEISTPKSLKTAGEVIPQIIANVSSNMYGGVSAHRLDEFLEPYAAISYRKTLKKNFARMAEFDGVILAEDEIDSLADYYASQIEQTDNEFEIEFDNVKKINSGLSEKTIQFTIDISKKDVIKEVFDTFQSLEFEISSLYSGNGQTPFVTFNFGLSTGFWGREIQKGILKNRLIGLGEDHRTPVFPKLVFTLKDGVNLKKTDPNYDIKRLAVECSAKRIYPDILSYEKVMEIYGFFVSPMGCVRGYETITTSGVVNEITSMENLWDTLSRLYPVQKQSNETDEFIDIPKGVLQVVDSHNAAPFMTPVLRMVKNHNNKWMKVTTGDWGTKNSRVLFCTDNHPLPVVGKGRVLAKNLSVGDSLTRSVHVINTDGVRTYETNYKSWLAGFTLCDGCLSENSECILSFAMDETEVLDRIQEIYPEDRLSLKKQVRGDRNQWEYYDLAVKDSQWRNRLVSDFSGVIKNHRSIPESLLRSPMDEKEYFLAGMIDADGYVRKSTAVIGSTNKTLAYAQMMLVESMGIKASVRINYYKGKTNQNATRYVLEFNINDSIASKLSLSKKKESYINDSKRIVDPLDSNDRNMTVSSVEYVSSLNEPSYDLTTDSDYFDVSGIVSHNCRSFLTEYRSPETGEVVTYGRRNIGVVSLNLPNIALSTSTPEEFMKLLDERAILVHDGLMYRYNRLAGTLAKNAPILYQYGATGHRLSGNEVVQPIFDNGEATASIGYIGLHEVATKFWGNDWQDNEDAKAFTVGVLERLNYWKSKWADETGIAFSVYGTPAESLCSRFAAIDKETFGEVKDITDKGYYTNSFHLDVRKKVTPFEKIDFESAYTPLSTGGNICYVEQPSLVKNLDAFEAIWDYMHDHVPFSGINTPISRCLSCGYHGDFDADVKGFFCPECNNRNPETIEVIQRMCGYISSVGIRKPISGRVKEIKSRVKHG
jgi:hypothetical protein